MIALYILITYSVDEINIYSIYSVDVLVNTTSFA